MIDALGAIDSRKHEVIIKWQLFESAPPNIPLEPNIFRLAYQYAAQNEYKTTASVFDMKSLCLLMDHEVPFVKIACRKELWDLIGEIPRRIPVYASCNRETGYPPLTGGSLLYCIPKYPALEHEYGGYNRSIYGGISDHTVGPNLWFKYMPAIWEKHVVLTHSSDNPDGGAFAMTPEELKEVIG